MKEDKTKQAGATIQEGKVVKKALAKGSKSEHVGVFLETKEGKVLKLRRMNAPPFVDMQLEQLVGKYIKASGLLQDYVFITSSIEIIEK